MNSHTTRRFPFFPLALLLILATALQAAGCAEDEATVSGISSQAARYNIGDDVLFSSSPVGWTSGFMQGFEYHVSAPAYLESLSIITTAGGIQARMALYRDDGTGNPGALVSASVPQTTVIGVNTFPVPSAYLTPGFYWIVVNAAGTVNMWRGPGTRNYVAYSPLPITDPWPGTYPATTPGPAQESNFYMTVVAY